MHLSPSLKIGVLRGGPSPEYEVSLKSGANILKHLSSTHNPIDIFISKNGEWHVGGLPKSPEKILKSLDVVWNALHGPFGEDGTVQEILDSHGVRYSGSGRLGSAMAMNKKITKDTAVKVGIKTPVFDILRRDEDFRSKARIIFNSMPHPLIIKPVSSGSSLGVYIVQTLTDLLVSAETIFSAYESALVEEYIAGREATCLALDDFRGSDIYTFPPTEIVPPAGAKLFDWNSKYGGQSKEICPGNFNDNEKREIEEMARMIHSALNLSHYSRSDFIVSPKRGVYFLEVNTLPGTTAESLLPKSVEAVGLSMPDFIHHVLGLALNGR